LCAAKQAPDARFCFAAAAPAAHASRFNSVFPHKKRFPRALFPSALKTGRRFSSVHFTIVIPKSGEGYAVVIPKKIAKLSVTRHLIKRQITEALQKLPLPPAGIIFSHSSFDGVHYRDMEKELAELLSSVT
jgi:ribonuclease P protein component